ncbi:MAG: hypothetical protein ACQSGP_05510 [Frankia sp.]
MSTRCVIAAPTPDGAGWAGRYCHYDGNPSTTGRILHRYLTVHPAVAVRAYLIHDHHDWTALADSDDMTASTLGPGDGDPNAWITHDGDRWATQWAYILGDDHLTITHHPGHGSWVHVADIAHTAHITDADWTRLDHAAQP